MMPRLASGRSRNLHRSVSPRRQRNTRLHKSSQKGCRKEDMDIQTVRLTVTQFDRAPMREDDRARDRQAQSHPLAIRLARLIGAIERLENLGFFVIGNTRTIVLDF